MHGCRPRQQLQSHLYICHRRKLCNDMRGTFQKRRQQSGQVRFTILQSKNPLVRFSSACRIDIESIDLRKGINNLGGISIYDRYIVGLQDRKIMFRGFTINRKTFYISQMFRLAGKKIAIDSQSSRQVANSPTFTNQFLFISCCLFR